MRNKKRMSLNKKNSSRKTSKKQPGWKMMKKYSITEAEARHILKNILTYQSLHDNHQKTKKIQPYKRVTNLKLLTKLFLNNVKYLINEDGLITFNILTIIKQKLNEDHKLNHKITDYFFENLSKKNKMSYVTLHGEQISDI
ncbi:hypothetical protein DMUE_4073 [Dictyocoela muelleri]|nr:hypothetical protein DMUE_4073 [Dictyocoela muelleri]